MKPTVKKSFSNLSLINTSLNRSKKNIHSGSSISLAPIVSRQQMIEKVKSNSISPTSKHNINTSYTKDLSISPKLLLPVTDPVSNPHRIGFSNKIKSKIPLHLKLDSKSNHVKKALARDLKFQTKLSIIELFENKVNARIKSSVQILLKSQQKALPESISITHSVLLMNLRLIEAHIDSSENDFQRLLVLNSKDQFGRTCLHYASSLGQIGSIEMMMIIGADPRIKDAYGRTPLHYTALQDSRETVEILHFLFKKACKNIENVSEDTNYHTVARLIKYKKLKKMAKIQKPINYSVKNIGKNVKYLDYSMLELQMQRHIEKMNCADMKSQIKRIEVQGIEDYINNVDDFGRSALHFAAMHDKIAVVRVLLEYGANADLKDINGQRPLELSASRLTSSILLSKMKTAKKVNIEKNISINEPNDLGIPTKDLLLMDEDSLACFRSSDTHENYLHLAVKSKNLEAVQILLHKNISPASKNKFGWNSVHLAIKSGDLKILSLIVKGTEETEKNKNFRFNKAWIHKAWTGMDSLTSEAHNIFHIAVVHASAEILEWLIDTCRKRDEFISEKKISENFGTTNFGKTFELIEQTAKKNLTCFLMAAKVDKLEAAELLIKNSCNLYAKNDKLQNALHIATIEGNKKIVEFLIKSDSDYNKLRVEKDAKGRLPKDFDITGRLSGYYYHIWDYAKIGNVSRLKMVIITKTFSINDQTPKKKLSALHVAVENFQTECIKTLIQMGADIKLKNASGNTPLDLALLNEEYKYESTIITLLRGQGSLSGYFNLEKNISLSMSHSPQHISKNHKFKCKDLNDSLSFPKLSAKNKRRSKLERATEKLWIEVKQKIIEKNTTVLEIFNMMDEDHDGALSFVQFHGLIIWLGLNLRLEQIQNMAMIVDSNQNGLIEYNELSAKFQDLLYKEKQKSLTLQVLSKL